MFSCKSNTDSNSAVNDSLKVEKPKVESVKEIETVSQKNNQPKFNNIADFKIIGNLEKIIDESDKAEKLGCDNWEIESKVIDQIFPKMKQVTGNEWNSYCYHYPCSYKGIAYYNGKEYNLYINSASYIVLHDDTSKEKLYFILEKKNSSFLKACDCCED